jgi:hypothetical protein
MVSIALQAENATTEMLSTVVKALPQEAALDLIVGTKAMLQSLGSCADIIMQTWDVDQYCQHQGWKEVVTVWKNQMINTTVREFDEEGADAENAPFQELAMKEAIQAVKDGMTNRAIPGEGQ